MSRIRTHLTALIVTLAIISGAVFSLPVKNLLTSHILFDSCENYEVTVRFSDEAGIPDGARLAVTEIEQSSLEYQTAAEIMNNGQLLPLTETNMVSQPLNDDSAVISIDAGLPMDVLDIAIIDSRGREIEPLVPVQVEVVRRTLPEGVSEEEFLSSVMVSHLRETTEGIKPEIVATGFAGLLGELTMRNDHPVMSFETGSFSVYTVSWTQSSSTYRVSIHYGYMDGDTFVELPASQFNHGTPDISRNTAPNYLIYDMSDYEFDYAYRVASGSSTKTNIQPYLRARTDNRVTVYSYYDTSGTIHNLGNNDAIYMVYKAKTQPTEGGTPTLYVNEEDPDIPNILKSSRNNHDGTRTLSLSITGHEVPLEVEKLADVIVIYDISGSMNRDMEGHEANSSDFSGSSRLEVANQAAQWLAESLLSDEHVNREGEKLIRMALVSFSNRANVVQEFTDDPEVFNDAIESLTAIGGTNWEDALRTANRIEVDPGRATFIIFVSDGDPTWRMTRYDVTDANLRSDSDMSTATNTEYYRNYNVFGQGSSDAKGRNYAAAFAEVESILEMGKSLFTIGISSDVTNMARIAADAELGADHSFTAENEEDLVEAFEEIKAAIIGQIGWSGVNMIDGITGLSSLVAKAYPGNVDIESFTYTKSYMKDGQLIEEPWDPKSENCNEASFNAETGAVEWNMGDKFQLGNDITYTVSFRVWPSQQATDLVTDLNNNTITYDELPEEIKDQIVKVGDIYTVKTNTEDAYVTYYPSQYINGKVTIVGDAMPPIYFDEVDPLVVNSMPFSVSKVFADELTGGEDRVDSVVLVLERRPYGGGDDDWEPFEVSYTDPDGNLVTNSSEILLSDGNNWATTFYISPGLVDADGDDCNLGYEYRLTEPGIDYHYEIVSEILRPMYYGFNSLAEALEACDGDESKLVQEFLEREVYIVKEYLGDSDDNMSLTAENVVKGGINVSKYVVDYFNVLDPDCEETFIIRGSILDPDGNPYTFNLDWDTRTDVSGTTGASEEWLAHQNDPIAYHIYDADGTRIGYKMHFASTNQIELELKYGQYVRFINVPQDCTYSFREEDADMPEGYGFLSVDAYNRIKNENGEFVDSPADNQPTVSADGTVSGIVYGNTEHNVEYTNKYGVYEARGDVVLEAKKELNGRKLQEGEFSFVLKDADGNIIETVTNDANGKVVFSKLEYLLSRDGDDQPFIYTIEEVTESLGGITYSQGVLTVLVEFTDNGDGTLDVQAYYSGLENNTFINTYYSEGEYVIEGEKEFNGQLEAGMFTVQLLDEKGNVVQTVTNDEDGKFSFDKLTWDRSIFEDGKGGYLESVTFTYTIQEVNDGEPGYTYDDTVYTVTLTLTDDGEGNIIVTDGGDGSPYTFTFTNSYDAEGEVVLSAKKELNGLKLKGGEFSFVLKDADGNIIETVSNDADGNVIFSKLEYLLSEDVDDLPFIYTIEEVAGEAGGMTYSNGTITVMVEFTDNGDGTLDVQAYYSGLDNNTFINTYDSKGEYVIEGEKQFTGMTLEEGMFTVELLDEEGNVVQTVTNDADGKFSFDKLTWDRSIFEDGQGGYLESVTLTYTIREVNDNKPGYSYDDTVYTITLTLTDDGEGNIVVNDGEDGSPYVFKFENSYESSGEYVIEGEKQLNGLTLEEGMFTVELLDGEGNVVQTVTNDAEGKFSFDKLTWDRSIFEDGQGGYLESVTLTYTIHEVNDNKPGYTYDDTVYTVNLTLTDDGKGHIVVNDGGYGSPYNFTFTNTYAANGEYVIEGEKQLIGHDLEEGMFTVELLDEEGNVVQTVTNDAEGKFSFDKLTWDRSIFEDGQGGYLESVALTYTIREVNDDKPGYSYDDTVYTVTLTLTDDGEGNIIVSDGEDGSPYTFMFVNEYDPRGEIVLEATKTLKGGTIQAGQFTFELRDQDGKLIETAVNDADGNVAFTIIKVDRTIFADGETTTELIFTVNEVIPEDPEEGMTYDERTFTATVTLTDNGGVIEVSVEWSVDGELVNIPEFINYVEVPDTGDGAYLLPYYIYVMLGSLIMMNLIVLRRREN